MCLSPGSPAQMPPPSTLESLSPTGMEAAEWDHPAPLSLSGLAEAGEKGWLNT